MPSSKVLIALRVSDQLNARIRHAAAADGRTVTNFLEWHLARTLTPAVQPGRQVDIEEITGAIASRVKGGPIKPAARHK